jgi:hypothetical protein
MTNDNLDAIVFELRRMPKSELIPFSMRIPEDLIMAVAQQAILEAGVTHAVASDILQARHMGRIETLPAIVGAWNEAKACASRAMRLGYDQGLTVINNVASARLLIYMQAHFLWAKHYRLAAAARDRSLAFL